MNHSKYFVLTTLIKNPFVTAFKCRVRGFRMFISQLLLFYAYFRFPPLLSSKQYLVLKTLALVSLAL